MTDKQKIIDGCDVSECEFYNKVIGEDGYCNIDEEHLCTCISYDNCHYKLYKCKEQECDQLKAENEHLAEKEEEARHYLEESYNYKQALQEIYETIIEFAKKDILTFPDRKPKENYKFIQEQCAEPIRQILQILQKCEVLKDVK